MANPYNVALQLDDINMPIALSDSELAILFAVARPLPTAAIRLRAERKAGQLEAKRNKPKGGRGKKRNMSPGGTGLTDLGVSRKQAAAWQKLGRHRLANRCVWDAASFHQQRT